MKYARILWRGQPRLARVDGDTLVPLERDMRPGDLAGDLADVAPDADARPLAAADAEFLIPVPTPGKIIAVGLNYLDHAEEAAKATPSAPLLFAKTANTLLPHAGTIVVDSAITSQPDFEGELVLVIGRATAGVSRAEALDHVFGYTIGNDVSARDVQFSDGQWMRGKSLDTFCPLGPYVVLAAAVPDPQQLSIVTRLNDTVMQKESTGAMLFSVAEIISYVSRSISLEPGDVILTGTPAGVGFARTPPVYLTDGDEVSITIEPIGTLRNTVQVTSSLGAGVGSGPSAIGGVR